MVKNASPFRLALNSIHYKSNNFTVDRRKSISKEKLMENHGKSWIFYDFIINNLDYTLKKAQVSCTIYWEVSAHTTHSHLIT